MVLKDKPAGRYKFGEYELVGIILAVGLALAFNIVTVAILVSMVVSDKSGLTENGTQILSTAFSGVIGVLGGYLGGRVVVQSQHATEEAREAPVVNVTSTGPAEVDTGTIPVIRDDRPVGE